jgi:hypothetical protein
MPLVLASKDANANELYAWKDITGVQYHYPNGYRNLIRTGEPFVYYRGVRRATGIRGQAEYFGQGVIGDIRRDPTVPLSSPKAKWAWFCSIEDYFPFAVLRQNSMRTENSAIPCHDGCLIQVLPSPSDAKNLSRGTRAVYLYILYI